MLLFECIWLRYKYLGTAYMTQGLKTLASLTEDPGSVPAPTGQLTVHNTSSKGFEPLFWSHDLCIAWMQLYICRQITQTLKIKMKPKI